jgi:hypothetical protein
MSFKWLIPKMLLRKSEALQSLRRAQIQIEQETTPVQYNPEYANEIWTHPGHTVADRNRERKIRESNYSREKVAAQRKQLAERRARQRNRGLPAVNTSDSEATTDSDEEQQPSKKRSKKVICFYLC